MNKISGIEPNPNFATFLECNTDMLFRFKSFLAGRAKQTVDIAVFERISDSAYCLVFHDLSTITKVARMCCNIEQSPANYPIEAVYLIRVSKKEDMNKKLITMIFCAIHALYLGSTLSRATGLKSSEDVKSESIILLQ